MGKLLRKMRRRLGRSAIAAATLAAVAACAVGVPQPAVVSKSHAERFPCENHACGCADAESCWRDCCCFTDREKLAWAERVGVTPPAFVAAAARKESGELCRAESPTGGAKSCCSRQASCCSSSGAGGESEQTAESSVAAKSPSRQGGWIMLHAAMKCRGLTVSVALLPPSLPAACGEFFEPALTRFSSPIAEPLLYESPFAGVSTPPPDAVLS
jgi:hypothetical protein